MRTFWTYFFIFLALAIFVQVFQFLSSHSAFELDYEAIIKATMPRDPYCSDHFVYRT